MAPTWALAGCFSICRRFHWSFNKFGVSQFRHYFVFLADYGKQKRRKFRTQRLEGLRAAHVWCQEYKGRLLRKAVQSEEVSLIRELLDEGVHVDNCDEKQRTALHLASVKGNATIVELLLSRGANPNCKDVNQNTPLMLACLARHIAIITR